MTPYYLTDTHLRWVNGSGIINTPGLTSSDPLFAAHGGLGTPIGLATDAAGNLYVGTYLGNVVWKIDTSLNVTRAAGTGVVGFSGDGAAATSATLRDSQHVAVDGAGNLYISDENNYRIRAVNMQATTQTLLGVIIPAGCIATVAGNGTSGYSGDGAAAIAAKINVYTGIAIDAAGQLYIGDVYNHRVRVVSTSGIINTVAGNGTSGTSGDGGAATSAELISPQDVTFDAAGNFYITDFSSSTVRAVNTQATTQTLLGVIIPPGCIATVAGNGTAGYSGDGAAAIAAELKNAPVSLFDPSSASLYIGDGLNRRIRQVSPAGIINTVAGNGTYGMTGDGGPASAAEIEIVQGLALVPLISLVITPADPSIAIAATEPFTATGNYSEGSTVDLSSAATWASATPAVATIAAGGLATGVAPGTSLISAAASDLAFGSVTGSTTLTVLGATGPSVSERSFACNGCFESSSAYGDVLKSLALSMAGFVVPPGDCWRIYAGSYVPPEITLADADCRSSIKGDFRLSGRDSCNGVKGQYIPAFLPINPLGPLSASPASPAWKKTDFPAVQRANYIAEDGGEILWKDIQLDFTISLWMAQRIARIVLERLRRQMTISLPAKLTGIAALAVDTIEFLHARWSTVTPPVPTVFQISHTALRMEAQADSVPAFGTDLVLRQTDALVYEFAPPTSPTNFGDYSQYGQTGIGAGNVE